jgi:hypothetical protein
LFPHCGLLCPKVIIKEAKTVTLRVRLEPSYKQEIARFAMIHRVDISDLVRLGVQQIMDGTVKPSMGRLLNGSKQGRGV